MEFVTGGAYNGKSKWVREQLSNEVQVTWLDGSEHEMVGPVEGILVVQHLEWIVKHQEVDQALPAITNLLDWERNDHNRRLILIGTDITKGIVPLDQADRQWRDRTGKLFQHMMKESSKAFIIWFGIEEQLK